MRIMQITSDLAEKPKVRECVYRWIENAPSGREFGPRDVQADVRRMLNGEDPYEGTITRYMRRYNQTHGRKIIVLVSEKKKSRYMKLAEVCDAEKA